MSPGRTPSFPDGESSTTWRTRSPVADGFSRAAFRGLASGSAVVAKARARPAAIRTRAFMGDLRSLSVRPL
jgi:hypothetical protein